MRLMAAIPVLLAACAGADNSRGFIVRDSAGITIAESTEPAWTGDTGWHLAAEPELQIGVEEGDSAYQLYRVSDASFLSDGRIVVASSGANALRIYGADGRFEQGIGRTGEAPGEFRFLSRVEVWPGDTMLALDGRLPRLTLFDATGDLAGILPVRQPGGEALFQAMRLPDGTLLAPAEWTLEQVDMQVTDRIQRPPLAVRVWNRDGSLRDTLGVFEGTEVAVSREGRGARIATPIFGHMLSVAVHGDEVFVGTGDSMEVRVFAVDGSLRRIVRVPGPVTAVTDADLASYRERMLAGSRSDAARESSERWLASLAVADHMPAFTSITVDDTGNLWTSLIDTGLDLARWNVFDPEGRWLGAVTFPERFRVYDIRDDRVLGRWQDEYDVEYIRVYPIEKD